jgi:precorrin-3B synthase
VPTRRPTADDACPGALRLHAAADGPLARVRLPGGMLTGAQLAALAELAVAHGDGALELTSRANIQLRALRAEPTELAERLAAAGLLPSLAHETVRNIAAPPLADAGTRRLVDELDRALCGDETLAALPGRFLFAIGRTPLAADVAAVPAGDGVAYPEDGVRSPRVWAVVLAGTDVGLRVPGDRVVETMLAAAHGFLAERAGREPRPWRLREIPGGAELIAARLREARRTADPAGPGGDADPAGLGDEAGRRLGDEAARPLGDEAARPLGDEADMPLVGRLAAPGAGGFAVGVLVPLGRLTGVQLEILARAERLAVTPSGGVVVLGLTAEAADRWERDLAAAGLVTEGDSKWVGVTTCAGRPGCAKALADVRADAGRTAQFVDGWPVHWVGCERGCGSPAGRHVRVEATPDGYLVNGAPVGGGELGRIVAAGRRRV